VATIVQKRGVSIAPSAIEVRACTEEHEPAIIAIEGESYRRREAQQAQAAKPSRRPKPKD
jgi:hypothetical protein